MWQIRSQLARASRNRVLVCFARPFEEGTVDGYVLSVGPKFFLVAVVGEGKRFNGFQCFRLSDVRSLQVPGKHAAFTESALKKRGERIPGKPRVVVSGLNKLLLSATRAFPLLTIHREQADPDICHIGRVVAVQNGHLALLEIGPDAVWDAEPKTYRISEITRVDFGGEYEEALHLVGGLPKN